MKWRIIIRIKLAGDRGSRLGNRIKKCLNDCNITFTDKTHTWEGIAVSPTEASKQLQQVFEHLGNARQFGGQLDHIWIYIDRAKDG